MLTTFIKVHGQASRGQQIDATEYVVHCYRLRVQGRYMSTRMA